VLADKGIGMKAISQFQPRGHEGGFVQINFSRIYSTYKNTSSLWAVCRKISNFVAVEIFLIPLSFSKPPNLNNIIAKQVSNA
jgi:hypothetical protein